MERWSGKVAVVTGACVGPGAAITAKLVEKGLKVVGLARRIDRIEALAAALQPAAGKLHGLRCNITSEDSIQKCFKWTLDNLGPVHVLINNANLTRTTNLTEGNCEAWRKVFDINVMALCICSREAVKIMREHRIDGHIVHMNSTSGHYLQLMSNETDFGANNVYPASKFAVTALAESLRIELKALGSKIKSISPGLVSSGIDENGGLKPEDVAESVLYVLSTGPNVQVKELIVQALDAATELPPSSVSLN